MRIASMKPGDDSRSVMTDLDYLDTGAEIAKAYGYSESTIRTWKERGHLREAGRDAKGRVLFRVREAEVHIGRTSTQRIRVGKEPVGEERRHRVKVDC